MSTIRVPAAVASLAPVLAFVARHARAAGFPPARVTTVELAVEEALTNICQYAYPGGAGDVQVRCSQDERHRLCIDLIDAGVPFDPLTVSAPDRTADLATRAVGGLGVFLLRSLVDTVSYRRANNQNILRLVVSASP